MKKNRQKKKTEQFVDDGRTIVDMNVDGFRWYDGKGSRNNKPDKKDHDKPTRKETTKLVFGMYRAMLPYLLIAIGCFLVVFLALYFGLRSKY